MDRHRKTVCPEEWASARAIRNGETVIGQMMRIERFDGTSAFIMNSAAPIYDAQGNIVGSAVAIMDITEQKRAEEELKKAVDDLERSNKELEQFAYVTSHDLKEPLRNIASFVGLLERRYKDSLDEKASEYIHYIVYGVKRMKQLIDDLLEYSRITGKGADFGPTDSSSMHFRRFSASAYHARICRNGNWSRYLQEDCRTSWGQNLG